jgi:preprotein translocase subunit SecG
MGAFMSVRGTANLLTRITAVLAACFMATSLTLAILSGAHEGPSRIVEEEPALQGGAPAPEEGAAEAPRPDDGVPLDRPLSE